MHSFCQDPCCFQLTREQLRTRVTEFGDEIGKENDVALIIDGKVRGGVDTGAACFEAPLPLSPEAVRRDTSFSARAFELCFSCRGHLLQNAP